MIERRPGAERAGRRRSAHGPRRRAGAHRSARSSEATASASDRSNGVARKASSISLATDTEVSRRPIASTFASFQRRAPLAVSASVHRAARTPWTLLAAIDTPVPVVQQTTPSSALPSVTARPTAAPAAGQGDPVGDQHDLVTAGVEVGAHGVDERRPLVRPQPRCARGHDNEG